MLSELHAHSGERGRQRPSLEVADIVRAYGDAFRCARSLSHEQHAVLEAILRCRTAALGGHRDACTSCDYSCHAYNSCRNRHCPKCQSLQQARWIAERSKRILPTRAFHVVFTLPRELRALALDNRKLLFDLLFSCATDTLLELGRDVHRLGADIGITSVLHTWTRDLRFQPHVHAIVTAGGLSLDQTRWIEARQAYLFPVRVMGELFRGKFLGRLVQLYERGELQCKGPAVRLASKEAFRALRKKLYEKRWIVYAKQPFGGAKAVFQYLGRYTHRVGISNQRLVSMNSRVVTFRTRGAESAILEGQEFLRRFLLHVLPRGFVKIRHHGLMASKNVTTKLEQARALLERSQPKPTDAMPKLTGAIKSTGDFRDLLRALTGVDLTRCPLCHVGVVLRLPLQQPSLTPTAPDTS